MSTEFPVWRTPEGEPVSCVEKIKVLNENLAELRELAQEALEKVSGQLIAAQEKERSRIARDLHDDICQRLALVSMELEQANRNGFPPAAKAC